MSLKEKAELNIKDKLNKKNIVSDERQAAIVSNAAVVTVVLTFFLIIGKITVNYVMTTKIQTWDIVLMLFILCVFSLGCMKDKTHFVPKGNGKELNNKNDKKLRIKLYVKDAVQFAIIITILEAIGFFFIGDKNISDFHIIGSLNPVLSYTICALVSIIGMFIIGLGVNYILGEHSVRKYNKYLDKFDE